MIAWATIVALILGVLFYLNDTSSMLMAVAELASVIVLFTLVCAAEAFSQPKQ